MIEFEDPAHEQLIQAIAARLGFELVSYRLELFGRKPPPAPKPGPAAGERRREKDPQQPRPGGAP